MMPTRTWDRLKDTDELLKLRFVKFYIFMKSYMGNLLLYEQDMMCLIFKVILETQQIFLTQMLK